MLLLVVDEMLNVFYAKSMTMYRYFYAPTVFVKNC